MSPLLASRTTSNTITNPPSFVCLDEWGQVSCANEIHPRTLKLGMFFIPLKPDYASHCIIDTVECQEHRSVGEVLS